MASLLVVIFVVEFTVAVVNTIGATTINNLVCQSIEILAPATPNPHQREITKKKGGGRQKEWEEVSRKRSTANNIGPQQLWTLYTSTPVGTSKQIREQRELQTSYLKVRRDLNATSSQDEFAKWAKLRRQHDKLLEELEKKSAFCHPMALPHFTKSRSSTKLASSSLQLRREQL